MERILRVSGIHKVIEIEKILPENGGTENRGYKTMENTNEMMLEFDSRSCNEGFARVAVAAFCTQLNPTLEEVADIKTAVSEAITNAVIHGYENQVRKIRIECRIVGQDLYVTVIDHGKGIPDVRKAMEPLYTTKPELDRSGMGFAFMEAFMDEIAVASQPGEGTEVHMKKGSAAAAGPLPEGSLWKRRGFCWNGHTRGIKQPEMRW